jgi:hypothetical protein
MLSGYAARNHPHDGVHDPISVRALYLRDRRGAEALVVVADILWYGEDAAAAARREIGAQLGLTPGRVLVAGTHTHSAPSPGGRALRAFEKQGVPCGNAEWVRTLVAQSVAVAAAAKLRARPAILRVARGESFIGINRRERRVSDGRIVLGKNPGGACDRGIVGLAVDGTDRKPIARVGNFACHGVVMGQESYKVSGDWPGLAARLIERRHGGAPFLFVQGGAGNINPRIGPQNRFGPAVQLAAEFARDFAAVERRWKPAPSPHREVGGKLRRVALPAKAGGTRPVLIQRLDLGPVRIVAYPGEAFTETAMAAKRADTRRTVMFSSCNGAGDRGYVPVREVFSDGGYEVDVTPYGPDAEGQLRDSLIRLATAE